MNSKKMKWLSIFALLIILSGAFFIFQNKNKGTEVLDKDSSNWSQMATESPDAFRSEVLKLASQKNPQVLEIYQENQNHPNPLVRASVVEALGYLDDNEETLQAFQRAMEDSDILVKNATFRGMARNPSPERERLILVYVNKNSNNLAELVEIYGSLGRVSQGKTKEISVSNLIDIASRGHEGLHMKALSQVASLAPEDERVIELLRSKLKKLDNDSEIYLAMQHLSALKDPWLIKKLPAILNAKSTQLREGAVRAVAMGCHPERWALLKKRLRVEQEASVLEAIVDAPKILMGQESINFLQEIVEKKSLSNNLLNKAEENLKLLKTHATQEKCKVEKSS